MKAELQDKAIKFIKAGLSDADIAKQLKCSRSSVWRVRSNLKNNPILDGTVLSERERKTYDEYKQELKKAEKKKPWWLRIFTLRRSLADGPFTEYNEPGLMEATQHHQNFLNNYTPQYNVQPIEVKLDKKKIIDQAPYVAKSRKSGQVIFPKFFMNPYQALDYIVLQDIWMHTICGTIIDVLTAFTMGKGIHPVLKLNDEDKVKIKKITETKSVSKAPEQGPGEVEKEKPEQKQGQTEPEPEPEEDSPKMEEVERDETKEEAIVRVLDENKKLLEPLTAIDESFSDPLGEDPMMDESFDSKATALVKNHWIYGRDLMTKEYFTERTFEWDGKKFPAIPNVLKVLHPRDIGFVQIDQPTLKLKGCSLMFSTDIILAADMIYLEHNPSSPIYNGKFYGYSKMHRMIGHGRALRKLIDRDFPNVASIGYAGFSVIAFREDSKGTPAEVTQNEALVNALTVGSPNAVTLKDPEHDMKVHDIDTDPKISEMIEMAHYHAEAAAKSAEVPTTLISKEKDPNRDTLLGVLRIFNENVIRRERIKIGKVFQMQWYMPNWRIIYKDKTKVLEQFHVEAEFDDFKLEAWDDLVAGVVELSKLNPLRAEAIGDLLGIENYETKIDPEGKTIDQEIELGDGAKITKSTLPSKKNKSKQPPVSTKL